MPEDNKLIDTLKQTIDNSDPTQKLIGLLAMLVDDKFNHLSITIVDMSKTIEEQDKRIDRIDHSQTCPFEMPAKIKGIEDAIQPLLFVDKYPKLAVLMFLGLLSLLGLGIDKIFEYFK